MNEEKQMLALVLKKLNSIIKSVAIFGVLILWLALYSYLEVMNRVDYSYFKITKSLEQIHNVKIDTYSGEIIKEGKEITADQEVQRKKNKKWHLRHLFK